MILFEMVKEIIWHTCRGIFWFITARDCDHCKWGCDCGYYEQCFNPRINETGECTKTIRRIYFERKDGDGNG